MRSVIFYQGAVVEISEDVGVHDQKGFIQVVDEGQGAGGARGLGFKRVIDMLAEFAAVPEIGLDQLGDVAHGQGDTSEAMSPELTEDNLEDGFTSRGTSGLRMTWVNGARITA